MNETVIFSAAIKLPAEQRQSFVKAACAGNAKLEQEVASLLREHDGIGTFIDQPAMPAAPTEPPARPSERPGTQIGPYKLLQQIGEGGMGVVYLAEQHEPVKRRVALKIIKPGMDSRQVIARFEAERQALSLMDHPNIARVLDAGMTASGRPFFVMELVKGQPITQYCDEHQLTPRQRLELLLPVCQAIQHAHQKGIIHRDIKPTNILVAEYDQQPVPKVIDFGVAKATSQALTEKTMFTGLGQIVGTLEYMSPEQAKVNQLDIDTRSDIYSLGVLLYELLTGSTPFDKNRLRSAAWDEMLRIIREEEPEKPSTRLSSADTLPSIAANRNMEPARLGRTVRGELDWIVMKALEKDRNRRYETASGFAADIQRYLADEPVQACPPSAGYRFRKFARRNKGGLAVAALVLLILMVVGSGVGWVVRDHAARQSRIGAQVDLVLGEVEQLAKEQKWPEALAVARRAEALTTGGADGATQERVRQVLNDLQMVARLEELRLREAHANGPGTTIDEGRSHLYAAAFRDFGVDIEALPVEQSTARLRARPAVAIALAAALDDWARVRRPKDHEQSKRLWALATALDTDPWRVQVRQASAAMDVAALVKLANAPEMARQPPQSQLLLASSLQLGDQPEQALALLERACESHPGDFWIHYELAHDSTTRPDRTSRHDRVEAGVRHGIAARALRPRSANTWNLLGALLLDQKKLDEAVAAFRKAIELDPKYTMGYTNLGVVLLDQKKLDEAIAVYRKAIELDPKNVQAHNNLGAALCDQKKLDEAIAAVRKAIELDPKDAGAHINLGNVLHNQKKLDDAIAAYRKAIELDPKNAGAHSILGAVLHRLKKLDEAVAAFRKAIELDPKFATGYTNLGVVLHDQKKLDEAIAVYRKAIELDPKNAIAHQGLGSVLHDQKKLDEAVACFKKAIELDPKYVQAYNNLGIALREQKKLDEAIACYQKAIELDPKYALTYSNLGNVLHDQKKLDDAIAAYRKAIELDPKYAGYHSNLGAALYDQKKLDEAVAAFRKAIELDPKYAQAHNNLGAAYHNRAGTYAALGQWAKAAADFQRTREVDPKNDDAWRLAAYAYLAAGDAASYRRTCRELVERFGQTDDPVMAERTAKVCLLAPGAVADFGVVERLAQVAVTGTEQHGYYHFFVLAKGLTEGRAGRHAEAVKWLERFAPKADRGWDIDAIAFAALAMAQHRLGRTDEAKEALAKGKAIVARNIPDRSEGRPFRTGNWHDWLHAEILVREAEGLIGVISAQELASTTPTSEMRALDLNNRAWSLATSADPQTRDPHTAVELAQEAVKLAPNSADFWNTLGVAQYRDGNFKEAVSALQKYRELRTTDAEWSNPFLLAMARWQLGDKEEARQWFDKGVQWMDAHNVNSETMVRFRNEAAELLGVNEKKQPDSSTAPKAANSELPKK